MSSPLNTDHIRETLKTRLPFCADLKSYESLPGDASNRRYYRLVLTQAPMPSLIVMQLADPEGFKASEEAVSGGKQKITELPFLNVLRFLQSCSITVPTVHYFDEAAGLLYLEDFGDVTLSEAVIGADQAEREQRYAQAIDTLVKMHVGAMSRDSSTCFAFGRAFDEPLLMWEFEHFLEYGVEVRRGKPMSVDDRFTVQKAFQRIAKLMTDQPPVFTHRDYHSRNLMVSGERLGVIDFQDALLGPATYDLASLLRDSYVALDEAMVDRLLSRYREGMCAGLDRDTQKAMSFDAPVEFRRLFDFTSIQRNLKAAGRFVYIDRVKQNPKFLADIPRTLRYVQDNLRKYPELHELFAHLSPYVPEWQ